MEMESERPDALNEEDNWSDLGKIRSWQEALLRANFPASFDEQELRNLIALSYPDSPDNSVRIDVEYVEDKDWVSHVQQSWKPLVIGDVTVLFPWHLDEAGGSVESVQTKHRLVLEGGAAFGTGDHPTTRLCCRWLQRNLANQESKQSPKTVLDYGCGSAILGLVALSFGADSAVGVDIDKDSLASATNNCNLNNMSMDLLLAADDASAVDSSQGLGSEEQSVLMNTLRGKNFTFPSVRTIDNQQYDLVVANILAPILIALAGKLASHTKKTGKLSLSGVITKQATVVVDAYKQYFGEVIVEEEEEGWVLITAQNPL